VANADLTNNMGVPERRESTNTQARSSTSPLGTPLNYADITKLRTRLAAINGARYTSANLDVMTKNDMIYAIRVSDDAAGI
jgi:hypothetical protein